jgi:hypothetical protein
VYIVPQKKKTKLRMESTRRNLQARLKNIIGTSNELIRTKKYPKIYGAGTGHSGNNTLVAGAFAISHKKYRKIFLEEFCGPFGCFCMVVAEAF